MKWQHSGTISFTNQINTATRLDVGAVGKLWNQYLNSGSRHWNTATELKLNRVLNLLFSLNFIANFGLILAELAILAILLNRDFDRYIHYLLPFALANLAFPCVITVVIFLKNQFGTFKVTYISTLAYTSYCVLLSAFLGETVGIHLILFSVFPIIFILYEYGNWLEISLHALIMISGIALALLSYRVMAPLYPIPPDIAQVAHYLCWFFSFGLLFVYSIFNWRQVHDTEKLLADEKKQTENLLRETIPKLEIAESKYRHLVDDSNDLIFQMNEDGEILSMNRAVTKLLGFHPEELLGRRIYEFIPDGLEGDPELNRNIGRALVKDFLNEKTHTTFRTTLRKKHLYEPVDVQLTLQKNLIHWKVEIIGKVSKLEEDPTQRFLEKEKGTYAIGNSVTQAEILSQKLTERLNRYFSTAVLNTIRICFREILINAIEHGNLGITFDEKTKALESGDYMEFLLDRQLNSSTPNRKVQIDYLINGKVLMFRVTDEGEGFDHAKFLERANSDPYLSMLEHGRGIIMTRNVFDTVVYNEKGNQIILIKKIPK
jgi:two-component system, sensor histidine kinase LadS